MDYLIKIGAIGVIFLMAYILYLLGIGDWMNKKGEL